MYTVAVFAVLHGPDQGCGVGGFVPEISLFLPRLLPGYDTMKTLETWDIASRDAQGVTLQVEERHMLRIEVLENAQFRVRLLKDGAWRQNRSWCVCTARGPAARGAQS